MALLYLQLFPQSCQAISPVQGCKLEPTNRSDARSQLPEPPFSTTEMIHRIQQTYWQEQRLFL